MPIPLIDEIQPQNAGPFAMLQDTYLKGGFRVASDIVARDAITPERRVAGMYVAVVSDGKLYHLVDGITNGDWVEYTPSGATTPGGSNTEVQFNDAGVMDGDPGLTFDKTTGDLTAAGTIQGVGLTSLGATAVSPGELRLERPGATGTGQISNINMYAYDGLFTSRRGYIQLLYDTAATDSYMQVAVGDASNSTTIGLVVTKGGVGVGAKPAAGTKFGIGNGYHKTTLGGTSLGTSPTDFTVFSVANIKSYWVTARIIMRAAGASGNNMAMFYIAAGVHQESGIFLNSPTDVIPPILTGAGTAFTATFAINGSNLCLQLVGNSGLTVNWQAEVEWQEVQ